VENSSSPEWQPVRSEHLLISCGLSDFGRIVLEPRTATGGTSFNSVDVGEGMVCISGDGVGTTSGYIGATP
jgi:hypothetical protein